MTSWYWDMQSAITSGWLPDLTTQDSDPYHLNWAQVVDSGSGPVAYASLCFLYQVVAVDVTTSEPLWKFGVGGDFTLVDTAGNPLPSSEFPQCEHGLQMDGTHLLMMDNGWDRGFTRAVEFTLDPKTKVATETWAWGDEAPYFTRYHGGTEWLTADHQRVLVAEAGNDCLADGRHTEVVEVDRGDDTVVHRLTLRDVHDWIYRAHRVDGCALFANAKYCPALAARVDELRPILGI